MGAPLALFLIATAAAQAPAGEAPRPVPGGLRWGLEAPAELTFEAPTSVGPVKGKIDVVRLDCRGLEGWGRFEIRGALDPQTVDVGDPILSGHLARWMLRGDEGSFVFGSTRRLTPLAKAGEGTSPGDELWGAAMYLDQRRGGRYLEMRYRFFGNADGSTTLEMTYTAPLEDLGLRAPKHPFVEVKGPVTVKLRARLVRQ